MLKGAAKTAYQREYMRRKRAGLPTAPARDARRAEREQRRAREAERLAPHCTFCGKPSSPERVMVGDGFRYICGACASEALDMIAAEKKRRRAAGKHGAG